MRRQLTSVNAPSPCTDKALPVAVDYRNDCSVKKVGMSPSAIKLVLEFFSSLLSPLSDASNPEWEKYWRFGVKISLLSKFTTGIDPEEESPSYHILSSLTPPYLYSLYRMLQPHTGIHFKPEYIRKVWGNICKLEEIKNSGGFSGKIWMFIIVHFFLLFISD